VLGLERQETTPNDMLLRAPAPIPFAVQAQKELEEHQSPRKSNDDSADAEAETGGRPTASPADGTTARARGESKEDPNMGDF
jgi:hypothetical protein